MICEAIDLSIGCALMQYDTGGAERVVCYQSLQLQVAERNYHMHDKKPLAMEYELGNSRVYLLRDRPFVVHTDEAPLHTSVTSP